MGEIQLSHFRKSTHKRQIALVFVVRRNCRASTIHAAVFPGKIEVRDAWQVKIYHAIDPPAYGASWRGKASLCDGAFRRCFKPFMADRAGDLKLQLLPAT
jgi:hypothetical protein